MIRFFAVILCLVLVGCIEDNSAPEALHPAYPSGGAKIVWDLDARPFPEVPFPNDVATRLDPDSPTGRRVNVSLQGASKEEEHVRDYVNRMTGWGIISAMWVRFDAPLDLQNVIDRHQEDVPNFDDDAVYLVNVDPDSDEYGSTELIDLGRGNYPILMERPDNYFENDPRENGTNLVFESVWERDLNGNGIFDPIEDTDDDEVQDIPNLLDPNADPYKPGNTLEWYERETNTLIIRPVLPLEPNTTYAVVLTEKLIDQEGFPIDSPFDGNNHTRQTEDLKPLRTILPDKFPHRFDESLKQIRFAWTLTTGDPTYDMIQIRAGLYGHGPFARLAEEFPAEMHMIHNIKKPGAEEPLTFDLEAIIDLALPLFAGQVSNEAVAALRDATDNVDYVVGGSFLSPYFLADKDGLADTGVLGASLDGNPQDDDETFDINSLTGEGFYGVDEIPFICSVPKTIPGVREPPFNTMIYSHAISTTRLEIILFGGSYAKFGFALCVIDSVGHGLPIPPEFLPLIAMVAENLDVPNFARMIDHHRARDLDNDGAQESGGAYFTSDILHSRDNMRQTTIDQLQLVRILRGWDGEKRWPNEARNSEYVEARPILASNFDQDGDGQGEIAGDFNADGIRDFGGDVNYVAMGTSLGGIQTGMLAALEPAIVAAGNNAGGGSLGDIALRTTISNVRNGGILRMMGPTLIGVPVNDEDGWTGDVFMAWVLASGIEDVIVPFGVLEDVEDGYKVTLRNLVREQNDVVPEEDKQAHAIIRNGQFRVAIASDAMGATERRARMGLDAAISVEQDLMRCIPAERCGTQECPGGDWTCSKTDENVCVSRIQCIWEFDNEEIEKFDIELQAEFNRHTINSDSAMGARDMGDPLVIEIHDIDDEVIPEKTIDTFPENTLFENILYEKGTPLAALSAGFGLKRQTPDFRKFTALAQLLLEVCDPAVWATKYFDSPIEFPYEVERFRDGTTHLLMMPTVGDQVVPVSTSIAIARSAGMIDTLLPVDAYSATENQFLAKNFVYEGVSWFNRFQQFPGTLFDPDNLDNDTFGPNVNVDPETPLRATVRTGDEGISAMRMVYLSTAGEHTFNAPAPEKSFDGSAYMTNLSGWWLMTSGTELLDDEHCLEQLSMQDCDFVDIDNLSPPKIKK